jgi:hypothetical protein
MARVMLPPLSPEVLHGAKGPGLPDCYETNRLIANSSDASYSKARPYWDAAGRRRTGFLAGVGAAFFVSNAPLFICITNGLGS